MDELHRLDATSDSMDEPFGSPIQRRVRPPRDESTRSYRSSTRTIDLLVSVLLIVAQALAGVYSVFLNLFLGFAFDACSNPLRSCNYALGTGAFFIVPIVAILALAASIALVVRNRLRSRLGWWIPLAGIGITIVSLALAALITEVASGSLS